MPRKIMLTGLYTDVQKAADAIDGLRLIGLREDDIEISQGVPAFGPDAGPAAYPRADSVGQPHRRG